MDKKERRKGCAIIAKYLGYEYIGWNNPAHQLKKYGILSGYWGKKDQVHSLQLKYINDCIITDELNYDKSWNALIPVYRKIFHQIQSFMVRDEDNCNMLGTALENLNKYFNAFILTDNVLHAFDMCVFYIKYIEDVEKLSNMVLEEDFIMLIKRFNYEEV